MNIKLWLRWIAFILISQGLIVFVFFVLPKLILYYDPTALLTPGQELVSHDLITVLGETAIAMSLYWLISRPVGIRVFFLPQRNDLKWTVVLAVCVLLTVFATTWVLNPSLSSYSSTGISSNWAFAIHGVMYLVVAICEEYVFRGIILTLIIRRLGLFRGVLLASLIFTVFHWGMVLSDLPSSIPLLSIFTGVLSLFITGLSLSYIYLRTKMLLWPIAMHWMFDFLPWNPTSLVGMEYVSPVIIIVAGILVAETLHLSRTGSLFGMRLRKSRGNQSTSIT